MNLVRIRRWTCALTLAAFLATGQPALAAQRNKSRKLWIASIAALVGANLADALSSRGRYETNPLLRTANGNFSFSKGILLKSAGSAGAITLQMFLVRNSSETALVRTSAAVNFASAGALTALAVRNSRIPAAARDYSRVSPTSRTVTEPTILAVPGLR